MIGNRPAIDARFDTRFVVIDRISDQQFALRVDEFRVGHGKIKARIMALKRIVDGENFFQWREWSGGIAAGGHENVFALIASHAEVRGGEQELVFQFANVNRGGLALRDRNSSSSGGIPTVSVPKTPIRLRVVGLKPRHVNVTGQPAPPAAKGIDVRTFL